MSRRNHRGTPDTDVLNTLAPAPATVATILVVDDGAENRSLLTTLLTYAGHRLIEAADGAAALGLARSARPDLIITDILMPIMDGPELVRRLRADVSLAAIPVMLYTAAHDRREADELAARYGIDHILVKPCEPERVLSAVAQALGEHAEIRANRSHDSYQAPQEGANATSGAPLEALQSAKEILKRSEAALAAAYRRASSVRQSDRLAIAFELHDHIGQDLSTVKLSLQMLLRVPGAHGLVSRIHASISCVDAALQRVRALSKTLRPLHGAPDAARAGKLLVDP